MPLYDFRCGDCDHNFEALQKSGERVPCEACGSTFTAKMPCAPNIIADYGTYKTKVRKETKIREMTKKFTEDK